MAPVILLGIGAGLVSALLTASIIGGSPLAIALVWLAPLPLMIAGLGWHWLAAALGASAGAAAISVIFNGPAAINFFATTGAPAAALSLLASASLAEAREGPHPARPGLITLATVLYAALLAFGMMLVISFSLEEAQAQLTRQFERVLRLMLRLQPDAPLVIGPGQDVSRFPQVIAQLFPSLLAAMAAIGLLTNLWIAGRVVRKSGRLQAAWPFIPAMRLPRLAVMLAGFGFGLSFTGGYPGLAGMLILQAMILAFTLQGFAVLHFMTQGTSGRGFMLFSAWFLTLVFGFPALVLALAGFADFFFDFRKLNNPKQT